MLETDATGEMLEIARQSVFVKFYCKKRDSGGDVQSQATSAARGLFLARRNFPATERG
jgi:hypothetical protein